jgi:hypothetical protein
MNGEVRVDETRCIWCGERLEISCHGGVHAVGIGVVPDPRLRRDIHQTLDGVLGTEAVEQLADHLDQRIAALLAARWGPLIQAARDVVLQESHAAPDGLSLVSRTALARLRGVLGTMGR